MNEREALKLALEAAEGIVKSDWRKWQELASLDEFERWVKSRALHMATAIKEVLAQQDVRDEIDRGAKTLRETYLAQPEQEPVACIGTNGELMWLNKPRVIYSKPQPLYTTPPQRTWVGLTDVEIWNTYKNLWMFHPAEEPRLAGDVLKFARAIEQAHGIKE